MNYAWKPSCPLQSIFCSFRPLNRLCAVATPKCWFRIAIYVAPLPGLVGLSRSPTASPIMNLRRNRIGLNSYPLFSSQHFGLDEPS